MFLDFLFHRSRPMLPLPYKRELHCHIIPGVDDGSPEMEFSMRYVRALQEMGVERIIFTPHHTDPTFLNTPERIAPIFDDLKAQIKAEGLAIEAEDFSFEYRLDGSFLQLMDEGGKFGQDGCTLRPLRGRYILIENSFVQALPMLDEVIARILDAGWYPVMAHPERYQYYCHRGMRVYEHLQQLGVEFQCNILSFAGYYGETVRQTAEKLLAEGYVNFLGSDMHNSRHVELIRKYLQSKDYAYLRDDLEATAQNDRMD